MSELDNHTLDSVRGHCDTVYDKLVRVDLYRTSEAETT
jgi:hypothetical protein